MIKNDMYPITIVPFLNSACNDKKNNRTKTRVKRHSADPISKKGEASPGKDKGDAHPPDESLSDTINTDNMSDGSDS